MFYDRFKLLADNRGISVHKATQDIGLSNSAATKWKNTGATPDGITLLKISTFFEITIDELLGIEIKKDAQGNSPLDDPFTYAMHKASPYISDEYKNIIIGLVEQHKEELEKEAGN